MEREMEAGFVGVQEDYKGMIPQICTFLHYILEPCMDPQSWISKSTLNPKP